MKFQKFVKSIGTEGIVYVRNNGERWLAAQDVFMKIPEDIQSITAKSVTEMPEAIESIINCDYFSDPCELVKAIMPCADGVIKDCVRIYATANNLCEISLSATLPIRSLSARTLWKCTPSSTAKLRKAKQRLCLSRDSLSVRTKKWSVLSSRPVSNKEVQSCISIRS